MPLEGYLFPIDLQLFAEGKNGRSHSPPQAGSQEKGQVAKSTDLNAALVLLVSMVMIICFAFLFP